MEKECRSLNRRFGDGITVTPGIKLFGFTTRFQPKLAFCSAVLVDSFDGTIQCLPNPKVPLCRSDGG